jgi:ryanodine receptor 2
MTYAPEPIDTSAVILSTELESLTVRLAKNSHDNWATQRIRDGWRFGLYRDDSAKLHPCLVSYEELPESEKVYDRLAAMETLKSIVALGYTINRV